MTHSNVEGGYDMAFRLWLYLCKLFVAAASLSERITAAVKDHRTPPTGPPAQHS